MKTRMTIDGVMTVLLLLLMAYQITGQELHEWIGAGMLVMFLLHNILNIRWYAGLFKGRYTLLRIVQTVLNISVLVSMLCLGYSGIVMSRYVFTGDLFNGPMATARTMHLAASYWGFVLMSVHLGFHWGMILGNIRRVWKNVRIPVWITWLMRIIAFGIAGYGAFCFYKANIVSYMFLKNQFVFFDFEKSAVSVFAEYIAMMGFWIFAGFYCVKGIRKIFLLKKGDV
ncbi:MAG: DUF4405 domain-containing protein [Alistipes sp.]|nr:DUF4405 domain-containing protein [Alistipes sp.]